MRPRRGTERITLTWQSGLPFASFVPLERARAPLMGAGRTLVRCLSDEVAELLWESLPLIFIRAIEAKFHDQMSDIEIVRSRPQFLGPSPAPRARSPVCGLTPPEIVPLPDPSSPPSLHQTSEATPSATGFLEVQVVGGALLHSKKGGEGCACPWRRAHLHTCYLCDVL